MAATRCGRRKASGCALARRSAQERTPACSARARLKTPRHRPPLPPKPARQTKLCGSLRTNGGPSRASRRLSVSLPAGGQTHSKLPRPKASAPLPSPINTTLITHTTTSYPTLHPLSGPRSPRCPPPPAPPSALHWPAAPPSQASQPARAALSTRRPPPLTARLVPFLADPSPQSGQLRQRIKNPRSTVWTCLPPPWASTRRHPSFSRLCVVSAPLEIPSAPIHNDFEGMSLPFSPHARARRFAPTSPPHRSATLQRAHNEGSFCDIRLCNIKPKTLTGNLLLHLVSTRIQACRRRRWWCRQVLLNYPAHPEPLRRRI